MAEILKGFLMIFPEWLAAIFMIAGLCVAMLAAVRHNLNFLWLMLLFLM